MSRRVTIVVYHYVRELKHSRYPEIKGLSIDLFQEQLKYISRHYTVITMEDLIASIQSTSLLPHNALLLTFDDAYIDHYTSVFPVLNNLGIQGSFFPPAKAIMEHRVLDVHKIQFILASTNDKVKLVTDIYSMLDEFRSKYNLKSSSFYFQKLAIADRFDSKEVIFVKRILQKELPEELRKEIVDRLFRRYVGIEEGIFSREIYVSMDQLKCMKKNGMYVGSHGFDHYWLDTLDRDAQEREIDLSLRFLSEIGCDTGDWVMCYPYGAYNDTLLSLLCQKRCKIGLAAHEGIANLEEDDLLALPRLDTNDLPKDRNAEPNQWTMSSISS